jgi:hypothetical protein
LSRRKVRQMKGSGAEDKTPVPQLISQNLFR